MNIDVKLKHFYETSILEARSLAAEQLEQHSRAMAELENEHKQNKKKNAELTLKTESENIKREISRALSTEQLELKHSISRKQLELKNKLFEEVKARLNDFRSKPEYEDYLLEKIKEAAAFAQEDPLQIYLSKEDADKRDLLSQKSGFQLEIAEDSFGGGIRAAIPGKNILIDQTFRENLKAVYKEFTWNGGALV